MKLSSVTLTGFRNFKNATINLEDKTLIIGSNDVGKTNLLWALRLLLDRSLSDYDIEPQDCDFYAFEATNEFEICLLFENVTEDCVVSKLKGKISDDNEMYLTYKAYRDPSTLAKSYQLFLGPEFDKQEEIEDRYYRKVLNIKYISSRRDFHNYINREKNHLFQAAKDNRPQNEIDDDDALYAEIQQDLKEVDDKIPQLNFIASATDTINTELLKLSLHHGKQSVVFDASTSNVDNFINNVAISSKSNGQSVVIGGDGRLNQIYLALWASRNELTEESLKEVTIFCIEEPEAHLHPHQQRKLADYLNQSLKGQVLITSHSPQIASEFSPNAIVRLVNKKNKTRAASDGCSDIIDEAFEDFGYRMSIIPAEAFFADVVLLVEGPSEELFYKTIAKQIGIDLDLLNISILMVDGVGFQTFIHILHALEIDWVLRTDNDVMKIPRNDTYRFAGVQRCVGFYKNSFKKDSEMTDALSLHEAHLKGFTEPSGEKKNIEAAIAIKTLLEDFRMYISDQDLENDLFNSDICDDLKNHFWEEDPDDVVSIMQEQKAINMYEFLKSNKECLSKLTTSSLAKPILLCKQISESK